MHASIAWRQLDPPGRNLSDPDPRALQILDDGHCHVLPGSRCADRFDHAPMGFMRAMREIQPGHVHPARNQLIQEFRRLTGRPDRADDLRFSHHKRRL